VATFYISKNEISNKDYRIFLNDIKDKVSNAEWDEIRIDSSKWKLIGQPVEPYEIHYFNHPAYANYPCVNMSQKGARKYCEWLQKKLSQDINGYSFKVRLPTSIEWEYAASGGIKLCPYPWGGPFLRNKKGQVLCNYKRSPDSEWQDNNSKTLVSQKDNSDITAPSNSYLPNAFGLYNVSGNVAEMIDEPNQTMGGSWMDTYDKVTIQSKSEKQTPNPTVGFRPVITVSKAP
jgi:formylglycine-generating enzyme required for sulfatase activity